MKMNIKLFKMWFRYLWADIRIGWLSYSTERIKSKIAWNKSKYEKIK